MYTDIVWIPNVDQKNEVLSKAVKLLMLQRMFARDVGSGHPSAVIRVCAVWLSDIGFWQRGHELSLADT